MELASPSSTLFQCDTSGSHFLKTLKAVCAVKLAKDSGDLGLVFQAFV